MSSKTSNTSTAAPSEEQPTARPQRGVSVNRVILTGRLTATPELHTTGSGLSVTTVRVATNDPGGTPTFHSVVLWRQMAEFAAGYLTKGRLVYVEGRIQSRTWEASDGTQRHTVEVVASRFKALSPKSAPSETAA
jgi:single-strand DNA-binding protein